jgi:PAS domain S-box-containing protein
MLVATINNAFKSIAERNQELAYELEERRKAETTVREKEAQIRLLLASAAEGIYGVDTDGICTFCNPSCVAMLGYQSEKDLLGTKIHRLMHHSHADGSLYPEDECRVYRAYKNRQNMHVDNEVFWRADGSSFPVEYWSYPVMKDGDCKGAIVTFFDITERKEAETKLREEKNKFESIIAAMGDGISIWDAVTLMCSAK